MSRHLQNSVLGLSKHAHVNNESRQISNISFVWIHEHILPSSIMLRRLIWIYSTSIHLSHISVVHFNPLFLKLCSTNNHMHWIVAGISSKIQWTNGNGVVGWLLERFIVHRTMRGSGKLSEHTSTSTPGPSSQPSLLVPAEQPSTQNLHAASSTSIMSSLSLPIEWFNWMASQDRLATTNISTTGKPSSSKGVQADFRGVVAGTMETMLGKLEMYVQKSFSTTKEFDVFSPRHPRPAHNLQVYVPSSLTIYTTYTFPYALPVHQVSATIAKFNKCSESALHPPSKLLKHYASRPQPGYPHYHAGTMLRIVRAFAYG